MDAVKLAPVLLPVLLTCASPNRSEPVGPPDAGPAATGTTTARTTRYDDLLAFVPADMESVLVFDLTREGWPKELRDACVSMVHRGVLAGRKFEFPSQEGEGAFEGIMLLQGPDTLPTELSENSEPGFSYAVADVRRTKESQPLYFARLGPERTLYATTETMMREALQGRGPGGGLLAANMGWPEGVEWESALVLLREPDPAIPDEPVGNQSTALWLTTEPNSGGTDDETPPRFRVTHLAAHVTDPAELEFCARVKLRQPIAADQIPPNPTVWELWGGPFPTREPMRARLQAGIVLMTGRGSAEIPYLLWAMCAIGVRVFI